MTREQIAYKELKKLPNCNRCYKIQGVKSRRKSGQLVALFSGDISVLRKDLIDSGKTYIEIEMTGEKFSKHQRIEYRRLLIKRDGFICYICGRSLTGKLATIDHVIRRSSGGSNDLANLKLCCYACNQEREMRLK